jgi:Cu/Ag efflux protein CusF
MVLASAGCGTKETPRQYKFRGEVVRLDPAAKVAAIRNEKIEGWMEPMTMDYPMENPDEYKSLQPGDRIEAVVNVTSDRYWLTGVHKRQGD